ncbi:putative 2-aminoethylphosphonate ABC transporter ATP-binding protein [Paraburkholderia sp. BCC1876]|uniref:putative 2-aminoethylphosphonate ABC transporter ATP-binding protein n=1 Tax=Paraburkholderia sp. BCC1876 TaxID=2676303 RepID=UPI001591999E|nr:putative 2-aminoethylphosphonate ABC transporter ATP-binding protein [Paraburkholderia sp. BCC1876]
MTEYLRIDAIHKQFGATPVLKDVNLTIFKGEMVCFLGPSGCGKTTLLRIIAGLETQSAGTIAQAGKDISNLPPMLRDYGIVFQSYALFPNLTVADNVAYGLTNRKAGRAVIRQRVAELLTLVGLPDSGAKHPGQLSGGQQQRIALARALATSPGLLLLDEPLSALDARVRVRLRQEIRQLQQRLGVTTIMVTHDQEEALSMADRIVVMNHGVIEQIGTPSEIYREPATPFVADFVGKANMLPATVRDDGAIQVGDIGLQCVRGRNALTSGARVSLFLRPEDFVVRGVDAQAGNTLRGRIEKMEFLGAFCRVSVQVDGLAGTELLADLSYHDMTEFGLQQGSPLNLAVLGDRVRIFGEDQRRVQ